MATLDELLQRTRIVGERIRDGCPGGRCADFSIERITRAAFEPGDRVRDRVTGQGGTVEHTRFVTAIFPPADR